MFFAFMPYGVVLKDEHPTSNIERPTSNKKQTSNAEHPQAILETPLLSFIMVWIR